jgi:uncharacterized membrane protein
MLFTLPLEKLAMVAAFGGVAGLTAIYYVRNQYAAGVTKQPFYVEAIKRLKDHDGAKFLLGSHIVTKERLQNSLDALLWRAEKFSPTSFRLAYSVA